MHRLSFFVKYSPTRKIAGLLSEKKKPQAELLGAKGHGRVKWDLAIGARGNPNRAYTPSR